MREPLFIKEENSITSSKENNKIFLDGVKNNNPNLTSSGHGQNKYIRWFVMPPIHPSSNPFDIPRSREHFQTKTILSLLKP